MLGHPARDPLSLFLTPAERGVVEPPLHFLHDPRQVSVAVVFDLITVGVKKIYCVFAAAAFNFDAVVL